VAIYHIFSLIRLFYKVVEHLISIFYDFRCLLHINCIFFHTGKNQDNLLQNISAINLLEHSKIQLTDAQNYVKHHCSNSTWRALPNSKITDSS
jgi:hypothetical protein